MEITDHTMKLNGNLYLIVDPMPGLESVLPKVKEALEGGVDVIQLWNHWNPLDLEEEFITRICSLAHEHAVPVMINTHWEWLESLPLDGVHFDEIPDDLAAIKRRVNRPFYVGITCGNSRHQIDWAIDNDVDYISFCSMFPSSTANSCDLVDHDVVKEVCENTDIPVFVAGGITPQNLPALLVLGISGVASVSSIMDAPDATAAANAFKTLLNNRHKR